MSKYIIEWLIVVAVFFVAFKLLGINYSDKDEYAITFVWAVARLSKSIEDRR